MSHSSQLTAARIDKYGALTIPSSVCESADIEPPTGTFFETEKEYTRIVVEMAGGEAARHDPETAVQQARETRREPDTRPSLEEMLEGIAENKPHSDAEDILAV